MSQQPSAAVSVRGHARAPIFNHIYMIHTKSAFPFRDRKRIACTSPSPPPSPVRPTERDSRLHCKHSYARARESRKGNTAESIIPLCYSGKIRPAPCTTRKHGKLVSHAIIAHAILHPCSLYSSPPRSARKNTRGDKIRIDRVRVCDAKYLTVFRCARAPKLFFRRPSRDILMLRIISLNRIDIHSICPFYIRHPVCSGVFETSL